MLYQWLLSFSEESVFFNVFRYISFRTFISFLSAFILCWLWGPYFIRRLVRKQVGQNIREDGSQTHLKKQGTPTMGGGLIVMSMLIPCVLWANWQVPLVWACIFITISFAGIGYIDDYLKIFKKMI